ncbi:hypothetical protein SDC9_72439 [bioreactor metagenome]|uniref:Uncharacterized protein n=1 Tax=bioreactor metagenome TaxID=1076179 RepID=A0A644YDB7_9ZZZZ
MRVSHPVDGAYVIFRAFLYHNINVDCFFIVLIDGVADYFSIAVAELVVFVDEVFLVFFVEVFYKLLRTEQV